MNVSLYQAAAALEGNLLRQQAIAENLAAASVPGFKKQHTSFDSVAAKMGMQGADRTQLQFLIPSFKQSTSTEQGSLISTGVNTDLAIDGQGFFQVQGPDGQTFYTRSGSFRPNADGLLATSEGFPLIGSAGPIRVNPNFNEPITVSASGEVSQSGVALGKLDVVTFANSDQLKPLSGGLYGAGSLAPTPADPTITSILQGFLEGSITTPIHEMGALMDTLRHFEANQKIMSMQDERLGEVIKELSNTN